MLRALGLGLAAALVLVSGAAARKPLTRGEYVAVVQAAIDGSPADRLFEEVVNDDYYDPPCQMCRPGPPDKRTASGKAWLRSARGLRVELETIADRLDGVRPPAEVARLHPVWISAMRGCAEGLREIDAELRLVRPIGQWPEAASTLAFQRKVAGEMGRRCLDHFYEIIPAFNERGYVFQG